MFHLLCLATRKTILTLRSPFRPVGSVVRAFKTAAIEVGRAKAALRALRSAAAALLPGPEFLSPLHSAVFEL